MKIALGLALAGVSIALLAAPASARSPAKTERKAERTVSRPAVKQTATPGRPTAQVRSGTD